MPTRRHANTRTLGRVLDTDAKRTRDSETMILVRNLGLKHVLVRPLNCTDGGLIASNGNDFFGEPDSQIEASRPSGGSRLIARQAPVVDGGGSSSFSREETVTVTTPEYYGLVIDPSDADLVRVLRFGINGAFLGLLTTIDFSGAAETVSSVANAIQVKDVPGVPDGFALIAGTGADPQITLVNLATGSFGQTELIRPIGTSTLGTLYLDPDGPYLYAGPMLDTSPAPDEYPLFRTTLPGLTDTQEIGFLTKPGTDKYSRPGAWLPDRLRVGRSTVGDVPNGIDHVFLDPNATPQDDSTADILIGGGVRRNPHALGHDGASLAWFGWGNTGETVKIWQLPTSGNGADFGMAETYTSEAMKLGYTGTFPDGFWWTFYRVRTAAQSPATTNQRRIARVQFSGSPVTLPTPVDLDITAAEADQGWAAGEGVPTSIIPWFP